MAEHGEWVTAAGPAWAERSRGRSSPLTLQGRARPCRSPQLLQLQNGVTAAAPHPCLPGLPATSTEERSPGLLHPQDIRELRRTPSSSRQGN